MIGGVGAGGVANERVLPKDHPLNLPDPADSCGFERMIRVEGLGSLMRRLTRRYF
jgi:hypothetical protein